MNFTLLLPLAVTAVIAVVGWYVAHRLSMNRDRATKRRELRVKYLIDAYRLLESVSNRSVTTTTPPQIESALADIQLFGTPRQVELVQEFAARFAQDGTWPLDPLLADLREDLRRELDLLDVPAKIKFLRITFADDKPIVEFADGTREKLRDLAADVAKIEQVAPSPKPALDWKVYMDDYLQLLRLPVEAKQKLVLAAILLERVVYEIAAASGIQASPRTGLSRVLTDLANKNLISAEERRALVELYDLRSRIVHGLATAATEAQVAELLDLIWRLIRRLT